MRKSMKSRKLFSLISASFLLLGFCLLSENFSSQAQADTSKPINNNSLIFRSTDGGVSWSSFAEIGGNLPAHEVFKIAVDSMNSSTIYLATNNGVFKSTSDGNSWQDRSAGLPYRRASALIIDPTNSSNLYALAGGFFRSRDGGNNWEQIVLRFNPPPAFSAGNTILGSTCLAIDPVNPATIYVGARGAEYVGIYKSTDGGESVRFISRGLSLSLIIKQIIVDPKTPSTIYQHSVSAIEDGVLKYTDGAETYSRTLVVDDEGVRSFFMDTQNPLALYLDLKRETFKSLDGGVSWSVIQQGGNRPILLALDNQSNVYGVRAGSLVKSVDGGVTFNATNLNRSVSILAFDPKNPSVIYASDRIPSPIIENVSADGRNLVVTGINIHEGAVVLIDSEVQNTKIDFQQTPVRLIAKKAFKRLSPGQRVSVMIKEVDGYISSTVTYTKPF